MKSFIMKNVHMSDTSEIRTNYLASLSARVGNRNALREAVVAACRHGISRQTLILWGVQAGFSESYLRSLLSRIFRALGVSARNQGAGRKTDPLAQAVLASLRLQYGRDRARKLLRAALRIDRAEAEVSRSASLAPIAVPQLSTTAPLAGLLPPRGNYSLTVTIAAEPGAIHGQVSKNLLRTPQNSIAT